MCLRHQTSTPQVAFNANGDIFVADGYCNRRVMQYSADGTFIRSYTMANVRTPVPCVLHLPLHAHHLFTAIVGARMPCCIMAPA